MGPLEKIRVIDLSTVIMGPLAARMLGDMGADVIKVEPPAGDPVRAIGPMRNPGMGPFYMNANRNKRSIAVDAKTDAGLAVLKELIRSADVLLYNIRPNAMARLGLDYESCRSLKQDLIYCGAYGFGQDGPYAAKPAYDDLIQGLCAIPNLIAQAAGGTPRYVPLAMVDRYVGVAAANAVLGALMHRMKTGAGQSIEVPMFEVMTECVLGDHSGGQMFDPPIGPAGYPRSLAPERRPFATREGYICIMVWTDKHWASFLKLVGKPELIKDPRFGSLTTRTRHTREIHAMLEVELLARTARE
ncbi:MAG: CoA transferase, partial [Comamonadaceae bacterium]